MPGPELGTGGAEFPTLMGIYSLKGSHADWNDGLGVFVVVVVPGFLPRSVILSLSFHPYLSSNRPPIHWRLGEYNMPDPAARDSSEISKLFPWCEICLALQKDIRWGEYTQINEWTCYSSHRHGAFGWDRDENCLLSEGETSGKPWRQGIGINE